MSLWLLGLFCHIQTEKNAFRQIGVIGAGDLTKQSGAEKEERPGKRDGVKSDVHSVFHSRKQLAIIITHLVSQLRIQVALHQTLPKQPS